MKKLPVGIQSFEKIRTDDFYYVDKTPFIKKLVDEGGGYFFLSRPRRFGKSLFLDTLRQAFLGKRELFKGLYLEHNWDWSKKHPVIYISFGSGVIEDEKDLEKRILFILEENQEDLKITCKHQDDYRACFQELIKKAAATFGQKTVVLVDEYDKPILDRIENIETAARIREKLKNFYSVLKDADPYLKFCFLTGVTKFSKVSIFSGLNNLEDITISPEYATICGYTQEEFEDTFAERLEGVDLEEVRQWYNGYSWLGEPVYNPFDILLFLRNYEFRPYWFETGTPTFLVKLLIENNYFIPEFEHLQAGDEIIESFDIDSLSIETLLFQTGYLTIENVERSAGLAIYTLRYPNLEVKAALTRHILDFLVQKRSERTKNLVRLYRIFQKNALEELRELFKAFFASIPHDWYRKTELAGYEGFYASIFYCYFAALGLDVRVEEATNQGRLDMAVIYEDRCYLFEFKVVESDSSGKALEQLKAKKYWEKYQGKCCKLWLIGVEFSKRARNIVSFQVEECSS